MHIALLALNSSYIHTNLAVRYIAASLEDAGHRVTLLEYSLKDRTSEVLRGMYSSGADIYGFSVYIWNKAEMLTLAAQLKILRPEAITVFGGPEVFGCEEELISENPFIDHVITGEGEAAFVKLSEAIQSGGRCDAVIYGSSCGTSDYSIHKPNCTIADYDTHKLNRTTADSDTHTLNCTAADSDTHSRIGEYHDFRNAGIFYDRYPARPGQFFYYEGSRGCPYRCSYCMSAVGGAVRQKDADTVVRELTALGRLAASTGGRQQPTVKLIDRTFNCDEKRAEYIWEKLIDTGIDCRFHFEIRAELLTDNAIEILRRGSDIFLLEAGIQSTNPETLREIKRGGNPELGLLRLKQLMDGKHPPIHADLIAGLPHESFESFLASLDSAYPLCDELQPGFLKLLGGSVLRCDAEKYGIKFSPEPPYNILESDSISYIELCRLTDMADLIERYSNGEGFGRAIKYLTSVTRPSVLFSVLADHIPDIRKLSQREAYTALLEGAADIEGVDRETLRCLLCEDFAEREKGSIPFGLR